MNAPCPRWPVRALIALVTLLQFALLPACQVRLELFVPLMVALGLVLPRDRLTSGLGGLGLLHDLFGGAVLGWWTLFGLCLAALLRAGRATLVREAAGTQAVLGALFAALFAATTAALTAFKGLPVSWGALLARVCLQAAAGALLTPVFSAVLRRLLTAPSLRVGSHGVAH